MSASGAIEVDEKELDLSEEESLTSDMSDHPILGRSEQNIYKSSGRASTASMRPSTPRQIFENGLRYCNAEYVFPNGDDEQNRLAILHQIYIHLNEGMLFSGYVPSTVSRILDIGAGTGEWATSTAERFPQALCVATDISASMWQSSKIPLNLTFELDDARLDWTYSTPFDFIHIRGMVGAFSDWRHIYSNAHKHLKLGGQLEVAELGPLIHYQVCTKGEHVSLLDEPIPPNNDYLHIFNTTILSAARIAGVSGLQAEHIVDTIFLEAAGFSITKSNVVDIPLGSGNALSKGSREKHKDGLNKMALVASLEGLEAMSMRLLTQHLDWEAQDVRDLCGKVAEEVKERRDRAYVRWCVVVARKVD